MHAISQREDRYRLPGEPAESPLSDEIGHWRIVYQELLITIDEFLERQPASTSTSSDGRKLQARRQEFASRLEHWRHQVPQSSGS